MGKMEEQVAKNRRRANIRKIILGSVALVGILSIGLIAPNALGAMSKLGILPRRRQGEIINRSRDRLIQQGLLKYEGSKIALTPKGEAELRHLELADYEIKKPRRWDGRWRVLIFDIPEKKKSLRDKVRCTLSGIGFRRAQDSVWIYPYDCEDLITLLKADFKIGKDVLYLVVEQMEYDRIHKEYFGLV
jgi:DNA-binding transcriptional regulator PaaX